MAKTTRVQRVPFTREMRQDYTILIPMMCPIHFAMIGRVLTNHGYNVELLENNGPGVVEEGLKYVHNDTCYPALLVIGQMLDALSSGKYDLNKTAVLISQTGGGCRASNYIFLLRRALQKAGYAQIPVVSLNVSGLEKNSGFALTVPLLHQALAAVVYGDGLMALSNQVKAYEVVKGEAMALVQNWVERLTDQFAGKRGYSVKAMTENFRQMAAEFSAISCQYKPKVKVGIVGEIYVKYASLGNNNLEDFLAEQDCEVMVPGLLDFVLYTIDGRSEKTRLYGGDKAVAKVYELVSQYIQKMQGIMVDAIAAYPQFTPPSPFAHTKAMADGVIGVGCNMGEGWLLTAEMVELTKLGYGNIVCTQPFGCLPNHICGKGMIRKIRLLDERANIVPIDYDPSATRVNQENRIKLMLAVARENLSKEQGNSNKPHVPGAPASQSLDEGAGYGRRRRWLWHAPSHS